ncbi:MAG: hypothetical protein P4M14_02990 [Gammaproteobacteria bacterium]|nr:hypothetical protein [Gammaproteobacteria bacterium]
MITRGQAASSAATMASPPHKDLSFFIKRFILSINKLIQSSQSSPNLKQLNFLYSNLTELKSGRFYTDGTRNVITVEDYIHRFIKYLRLDEMQLAYIYIYMQMFLSKNKHPSGISDLLNTCNFHRLFCTAAMVTAKFHQDKHWNNKYYTELGGISLQELNVLELDFIEILEFEFHFSFNLNSVTAYEAALDKEETTEAALTILRRGMLTEIYDLLDNHSLLIAAITNHRPASVDSLTPENKKAAICATADALLQSDKKTLSDKISWSLAQLPQQVTVFMQEIDDKQLVINDYIGNKTINEIKDYFEKIIANMHLFQPESQRQSATEHLLLLSNRIEMAYLNSIKPFLTLPNPRMDDVNIEMVTSTPSRLLSDPSTTVAAAVPTVRSSSTQVAALLNFTPASPSFKEILGSYSKERPTDTRDENAMDTEDKIVSAFMKEETSSCKNRVYDSEPSSMRFG